MRASPNVAMLLHQDTFDQDTAALFSLCISLAKTIHSVGDLFELSVGESEVFTTDIWRH